MDADVVGSKYPDGQTRHWLVNGVTISGTLSSLLFDFQLCKTIKVRLSQTRPQLRLLGMLDLILHQAAAPTGMFTSSLVLEKKANNPASYVVVIYAQPSTFAAPAAYSQPNLPVGTFDFNAYVQVCSSTPPRVNGLPFNLSQDSGLGPLVAVSLDICELLSAAR